MFLRRGGSINCQVSGARHYLRDLIQGGLEIPCVLLIEGDKSMVDKMKSMLEVYDTADTCCSTTAKSIEGIEIDTEEKPKEKPSKKVKVDNETAVIHMW